jgi:hypothetical protein
MGRKGDGKCKVKSDEDQKECCGGAVTTNKVLPSSEKNGDKKGGHPATEEVNNAYQMYFFGPLGKN